MNLSHDCNALIAFLEGGLGETILWHPKNGFPQYFFRHLTTKLSSRPGT